MIDGISADDPLNGIAAESLRAAEEDNLSGEFIPKDQADQDKQALEIARDKAATFIGGLATVTEKGLTWIESEVVVPDEVWVEGIVKFTPVFEKYNKNIEPQWYKDWIKPYKDEFKAGAWLAGVGWKLYQEVKAEKEEKENTDINQETQAT